MADEYMMEETEAPVAETDEEVIPKTVMQHTVEEIPELSGKAIGDMVTFTIRNVSEDGKKYDLEYMEEEMPEAPMSEEEMPGAPAGREAIMQRFS